MSELDTYIYRQETSSSSSSSSTPTTTTYGYYYNNWPTMQSLIIWWQNTSYLFAHGKGMTTGGNGAPDPRSSTQDLRTKKSTAKRSRTNVWTPKSDQTNLIECSITFDQICSIRFFGAKVSSGRSRKIRAKCAPYTPCRHSLAHGEWMIGVLYILLRIKMSRGYIILYWFSLSNKQIGMTSHVQSKGIYLWY